MALHGTFSERERRRSAGVRPSLSTDCESAPAEGGEPEEAIVRSDGYGGERASGLIYPSSGKRDRDFQRLAPRRCLRPHHAGRAQRSGRSRADRSHERDAEPRFGRAAPRRPPAGSASAGRTPRAASCSGRMGPPGRRTRSARPPACRPRPHRRRSCSPCAVSVRRVAVASPYLDEVNRKLVEFFSSHGFEIGRLRSLELSQEGAIHRAPRRLSIDSPVPRGSTVRRRSSSRAPTSRRST